MADIRYLENRESATKSYPILMKFGTKQQMTVT